MKTILAEATRGGAVESVHAGTIAVVDTGGRLVAWAGDVDIFAYFRSSAKPFQAIPVVERVSVITARSRYLFPRSHDVSGTNRQVAQAAP